jgi:hypothetical protein
MPRAMPAGTAAAFKKNTHFGEVALLDVELADGARFFLTDVEGTYPLGLGLATRIQSAGGGSTLKYFFTTGAVDTLGLKYESGVVVKNQGSSTVTVNANHTEPTQSDTVAPGQTKEVFLTYTGTGAAQVQLRFSTAAAGDAMDVVAWNPFIRVVGDVNIIQFDARTFIASAAPGWTVFSASVVTLTQNMADVIQPYKPWLKKLGAFRVIKHLRADNGEVTIQNLSGNPVVKEFPTVLDMRELEGAFAILRFYNPLLGASVDEYHGFLSEMSDNEQDVTFRLIQLLDTGEIVVPLDIQSEQCTLDYKGDMCGSTHASATCDRTFGACVTRGVQERFNGIPVGVQLVTIAPTRPVGGDGGVLGGHGGDGGRGGLHRPNLR